MDHTPKVEEVMTPVSCVIDVQSPISAARAVMKEKGIRHLPVVEGGVLRGIISERDTILASLIRGPLELKVFEAMIPNPLTVRIGTPLIEVLEAMHNHKYGSVIVVDHKKRISGIFTLIDSLRILIQMLQPQAKNHAA